MGSSAMRAQPASPCGAVSCTQLLKPTSRSWSLGFSGAGAAFTGGALVVPGCALERLSSPPSLHRLKTGGPFIMRRGALESSALRASLARPALLKAYGHVNCTVGSASELAVRGRGGQRVPLSRYLAAMREASSGAGSLGMGPYLFDEGDFFERCSRQTGSNPGVNYEPPKPFHSDYGFAEAPLRLALGQSASGIPFHRHTSGYSELAAGRKRWTIYPPRAFETIADRYSFEPSRGHLRWLKDVLPKLPHEMAPLECIQDVGDILFIPGGWWHATLNIGETVAVVQQLTTTSPLDESMIAHVA